MLLAAETPTKVKRVLPRPGEAVIVNLRGVRLAPRHFQVVSIDEAGAELRTDELSPYVLPGSVAIITVFAHRHRLEAVVVGTRGSDTLLVRFVSPSDTTRYRRLVVPLDVEVQPVGVCDLRGIRGVTEDISEEGARLLVPVSVRPWRQVLTTVHPLDVGPIVALGELLDEVTLLDNCRYAAHVRFTTMAHDSRARLRVLVERGHDADG